MNHSPRRQSRRSHPTLITVVIVFAQITLLLVATMAAIQPTPQMVQAAAQQAGLTGWFANGANRLIELVQPLWGAPAKALAQTNPILPTISAGPTAATFSNTPVGSASITQTIVLANIANPGTMLSAGGMTTCAVTSVGGVKCWGRNDYGGLGNGTNQRYTAPVDVIGLTSGVISVQNGWNHSCALTTGGGVKCWGGNLNAQLGDKSLTTRNTPVDVFGLTSGVTAIATGEYHTCALLNTGAVKCWGQNYYGQLGAATTAQSKVPISVNGMTEGVAAIAAGEDFNCALMITGGVKCWGYNSQGQLGDGSFTQRRTPVQVSGLTSGVQAITAGMDSACALLNSGSVKCWGRNNLRQLGNGSTTNSNVPVDVSGLTGVSAVEGGREHFCALTTAGGVKCWGYNGQSQLGDGGTTTRSTPADVTGLTSGAVAINLGYAHSCALMSDGTAKCWGYNAYGQLGNGTTFNRKTPINVDGGATLFATASTVAISANGNNTCAVTSAGGVKCWGHNSYEQLGSGYNNVHSEAPTDVSTLTSGVATVANGLYHTCALTTGGGVKCWGQGYYGQLGNGGTTNASAPTNVSGLASGVTAIASGEYFNCALTSGGGVKCWGYNGQGQLGNGSNTRSSVPVDVSGLTTGVSAIGAGKDFACAALAADGMRCWGNNSNGQLGNGSNTNSNVPVAVSSLPSAISSIAAGNNHTCALLGAGGLKCWGYNGYGQLGNGGTTSINVPVDVTSLTSGVSAVATGNNHTCALLTDGNVKCWGYNGHGQVGDNSTTRRTTPVAVYGLASTATAIALGFNHSCAILSDGNAECWGYNGAGQLGEGTNSTRYQPTYVSTLSNGLPGTVSNLSITGISIDGDNPDDFAMIGGSCGSSFPITLARGATCTVVMKAIPTAQGTRNAELAVTSNDAVRSTMIIPFDVSTSVPEIAVSPTARSFGSLNVGSTSAAQLVTIANPAKGVSGLIQAGGDSYHSCAITSKGSLECWGKNDNGQLGTGDTTDRRGPTEVPGLSSGVIAVAVGSNFTCALASGQVKCWGNNTYGQMADGTSTQRLTPVVVSGLVSGTVTAVTAGGLHACVLTTSGGVKCWGYNANGQLGVGNVTLQRAPVDASGLTSGVTAIDAGNQTTCALTSSGGMKCWGNGSEGQLGNGATTDSYVPVDVSSMTSGVKSISAGGRHTCAITNDNSAKCWGYNLYGQIGDGTTTRRTVPTNVNTLTSNVFSMEAGYDHTCALLLNGGIKCWGYNGQKQLGDGSTTSRSNPADVLNLTSGVGDVTAGRYHSCAITLKGATLCWGDNVQGSLGDGTTLDRNKPIYVAGQAALFSTAATALTVGGNDVCAITTKNGLKCWGDELYGQLGDNDGSNADRHAPVDVSGLISGVVHAAIGNQHILYGHGCAALQDGSVKCWGYNGYGQLGDGTTTQRNGPTNVSGFGAGSGGTITKVSGGGESFCALTSTGGIKCWGYNGYGQLGEGSTTSRKAPTQVTGITSGATAVESSYTHTCALVSGGVKCWGYNGHGRLGDGTTAQRTTPVSVIGLTSGVTAIALGQHHSCALLSGGTVKCWGYNGNGQLGDNSTTSRDTPVSVAGLTGVTAITAGELSTCALTSSGGVKCWGYNGNGQLGDGTATSRKTPVDVSGLTSGVTAIEGSEYQHTCAITTGGGLKCWGYNGYGQLGNGSTTSSKVPIDVTGLTSGVTKVRAGRQHTCAIAGGAAKCWGYNGYGQLGNGTTTQSKVAVNVTGLTSGVTELAAGEYASCAIMSGVIKCWGRNNNGQLGDGTTTQRNTAIDVAFDVAGVKYLAVSYEHSCAITAGGGLQCWGRNDQGQLGDNSITNRSAPVDVIDASTGLAIVDVVKVATGNGFTCALQSSGGVKCFGDNAGYRLGDGTLTDRRTATAVSGLTSGVSDVAAGDDFACAAMTAGGVKCWGQNSNGQLGDGGTTQNTTPTDVSGLTSTVVKAISSGSGANHTCALLSTGAVKCWGYNANGQLGNGTVTQSTVPVDVTGLTSGVTAIGVGYQHTCAIRNTGEAYCWGYNTYGALGNGTNTNPTTNRAPGTPVSVLIGNVAASIASLTINDLDILGSDAEEFTVAASGGTCSNDLPFAIVAGGSCTVPVVFAPQSSGNKEAFLTINSNVPLTPTVAVTLTGTGLASDLLIAKTSPASAIVDTNFTYVLTVTNVGNAATSGLITINDTLQSGLSFVSGSGSGFTCAASGADVTCTGSPTIAVSGTATVNITVTPNQPGTFVNSAEVAGGNDTTLEGSGNTSTLVGSPPPDLTLVIGQPQPALFVDLVSTIPMTVTNSGAGPTMGVVSVTLTLPTGSSAPVTFTDGAWSCSTGGQLVACTQPNSLLPSDTITVSVLVTPGNSLAGTQPSFNALVATPVEDVTNNNSASMTASVPVGSTAANLLIGLGGPVTATQNTNYAYTVIITNTGAAASSGTITVTDVLPAGVSFVSGSGSGFTCAASGQNVTCTSSTAIAINGTATINLTVNPTTTGVKANTASVVGGGDTSAASSNTVNTTVNTANAAPVITSNGGGATASVNAAENQTAVTTVTATDGNGDTLTYSITGGADSLKFVINSSTGVLTFVVTPDFETPTDVGGNNVYDVQVTVSDGNGGNDVQAIAVTVTDVTEGAQGIEYKLVYNAALNRYEVWMRSTATPGAPMTTSTAQVTIKAPHVVGSGIFTPTNLTAQVANASWAVDSRTDGPAADTSADYLSFSLDFPTGNHSAINWQAGQEILMFTFQNGGICAGAVSLMENSDPFNVAPNNPGQQIDVLALGNDPGNDFLGNYNLGQADCDRDGDGVVNGSDSDDDGDGLLDSVEGTLTVDTDSDGIPDALDLDSDGDGIPDNIEAQSTAGYVLPSGSDSDGDGLDNAYEGAPSGPPNAGLTPVNTDTLDTPDYKDADSDNAQSNDTSEAGLTKSNTDADKDGLDDGINSNDSAFGPVNAGVTNPATAYPNTNGSGDVDYRDSSAVLSFVTLPVKLILNGAYNSGVGLMRDDLRNKGLLPVTSPYTQAVASAQASVFSITGTQAIVDWVMVEVRNGATSTTVVARQAALLQRDGDVVALNGSSILTATLAPGNYYVSIRHRNHLGAMTGAPVALSTSTVLIDFTSMSATYGANAQRLANGVYQLWAGDTNGNGQVIGAGPGNELNPILGGVLSAPGNAEHNRNYIVVGYSNGDVNLDGQVIAAGPSNDINPIYNGVFLHPTNASIAANYIVQEQLP